MDLLPSAASVHPHALPVPGAVGAAPETSARVVTGRRDPRAPRLPVSARPGFGLRRLVFLGKREPPVLGSRSFVPADPVWPLTTPVCTASTVFDLKTML